MGLRARLKVLSEEENLTWSSKELQISGAATLNALEPMLVLA